MAKKTEKTDKKTFLVRLICLVLAFLMVGATIISVVLWMIGR